jgi:hypothetical protein
MLAEIADPRPFTDFAPLAERALSVDREAMIRLRAADGMIGGYVRLPFEVLAGRSIVADYYDRLDVTVSAADLIGWLDGSGSTPVRRDAHWLTALPPVAGWHRVETVPDTVIRGLIRSGAQLAQRAGTRAEQESLLSSVVLTARSAEHTVDVPLGPLSALTRMGFLPRGGSAAVDVCGGWTRVAAPFGSTFVGTGTAGLGLIGLSL